jgi:hypothetical protein
MTLFATAFRKAGAWVATLIDHWIGWHRLPAWMGLLVLVGLRSRLRERNLVHTSLGLPRTGDEGVRRAELPRTGGEGVRRAELSRTGGERVLLAELSRTGSERVLLAELSRTGGEGVPLAELPRTGGEGVPPACRRTADGTFNDLAYPSMGAAGTPFGRNVPLAAIHLGGHGDAGSSSPSRISKELLARTKFEPAGKLNVWAAAWVQFMVHDWFSHEVPSGDAATDVVMPGDETGPHTEMRIHRTPPDSTRPACSAGMPPTFLNTVTHWWDASQIYGSDRLTLGRIRAGAEHGKIRMHDTSRDRLPLDTLRAKGNRADRADLTGHNANWWIGLSLLHTLFAREHNAICDHLHQHHPEWSDEDLFAHARLINAAVIAKIHTLEWTPAILDHPTVHVGMRTAWSGLAKERGIFRLLALLSNAEVRHGIRHTRLEQHGVPYSITEEFVAVYRMHTLLPDSITFRSAADGHEEEMTLNQLIFGNALDVVGAHRFSMEDVAYAFGTQHAGAITLHNFPAALRELRLPDGRSIDLAAVDIFRDRERGVPRYNEFRRLVGRRPATSFAGLVGPEGRRRGWDRELRRVYGDIESIDLMVGLFAEPKPDGFGFSDTAFRIFLLMNGRRLQSDRFFTTDFTDEVYSREGMAWIERRTMAQIIADHWPRFKDSMASIENPFHLWSGKNEA